MEAVQYVRLIRDKYPPGDTVADADDQEFLFDLLDMHPEAGEKIGQGVGHFDVRRNGPTIGFGIVRMDGSEIDFSFGKCLRHPSHAEEVRAAMREAIRGQKFAARDATFARGEVRCPVTGETLFPETSHVHHEAPEFVELADTFADDLGGYEHIGIVAGDGGIGWRLSDEQTLGQWQEFHARNARLVVVSIRANLRQLRLGHHRR